jgi:hypothetical protein
MREQGLKIKRNINLTTNEGLWNFYRGISKDELILIKNGKYSVVDRFFTTNKDRALCYSNLNVLIRIQYQVSFGIKEQLRIFNKLHKRSGNFFDILCDRNLSFNIIIQGLEFNVTELNTNPVRIICGERYELFQIIENVLNERKEV